MPASPAAPRFEIRKCSLEQAKGKNKTSLPTSSKWQIGLFLWYKPYRGGCGTAAGGAGLKSETLFSRSPSGDSKGHSPWRAFGDLPRDGKVTRGRRGGAPSPRGVQRGVAPRIVKSSKPGCRAECLHHGRSAGEGPSPPRIEHWAREGPKNQKAAPAMGAAFWFGLLV